VLNNLDDYATAIPDIIKVEHTPLNELEISLGDSVTDEEFNDRYLTNVIR
jgi:hypothetical protein